MSVFFVSDLHLGHRSILRHTAGVEGAWRGGTTVEEHDEWVIEQLMSVHPTKRTFWWVLGDVAMDAEHLRLLDRVPGRKVLVAGNHDDLGLDTYTRHFEQVHGIRKRYGLWITHAPLHPVELRGLCNVHGHCHHHSTRDDPRYLNVCIEWLPDRRPISLDEIRERGYTS